MFTEPDSFDKPKEQVLTQIAVLKYNRLRVLTNIWVRGAWNCSWSCSQATTDFANQDLDWPIKTDDMCAQKKRTKKMGMIKKGVLVSCFLKFVHNLWEKESTLWIWVSNITVRNPCWNCLVHLGSEIPWCQAKRGLPSGEFSKLNKSCDFP